ncbi:MAG: hypothetical protein D3926_03855 [Desulfobacteraceae bacterium]|nr:MAG: hypothetical protein D3926_03855 [Desulfobacteraceae bacterium]
MKYYWWILQVFLTLVSIFFFIFGIDLLIGSYSLNNPYNFIMTFFAASLIILISAALGATFIIKMVRVYKRLKSTDHLS